MKATEGSLFDEGPPSSGEEQTESLVRAPSLAPEQARRLRGIFDGNYDRVFRLLRRLGLDAATSEDGAQQVFMVAARRLDEIELGKERAFLSGTAVRVAGRLRVKGPHRETPLEEPRAEEPAADELLARKKERELLDRLLSEMEEELRIVLVLSDIDGLGKREIAEALDIPEGTAASRLRRAREDLRERAARHLARRRAP